MSSLTVPIQSMQLENFRKFSSVSLADLPWVSVIMGPNGSEKTSLLWAFIFSLRCFNMRHKLSSHVHSTELEIDGRDFAKLINHTNYASASWSSITPKSSDHANIATIINSVKVQFKVKGNGKIRLTSEPWGPHDEKVVYAFMSESEFVWYNEEPAGMEGLDGEEDPILTSGGKNMRRRYSQLPSKFQVPNPPN